MSSEFEAFDINSRDWQAYEDRFRIFLRLNNVPEQQHVEKLLIVVGPETFRVISNLCAPDLPQAKTFEEICTILRQHLAPSNFILARYNFRNCRQSPTEDIASYINRLRGLAVSCKYHIDFEDQLRDQLVFGIHSDDIRKKLLVDPNLVLKKAVDIVRASEAASAAVATGRASGSNDQNTVRTAAPTPSGTRLVFRDKCGRTHGEICRYAYYNCNNCGEMGHLERMCPLPNTVPYYRRRYYRGYRRFRDGDGDQIINIYRNT